MLAAHTSRMGDLARNDDGSFVDNDGLRTVVQNSLFTDALANPDEVRTGEDRRGWWFDAYDQDQPGLSTGSKLWLIAERGLINTRTLAECAAEAERALAWMVDAGAASEVKATCERVEESDARLSVSINRPGDPASPYTYTWELHFGVQ